MTGYNIVPDNLDGEATLALLDLHLAEMHVWSPACKVHAMPAARLRQDDVTFFSAWDGAELAACGAIKHLDDTHGELKSMRATPAYRGKGAGAAILLHLIKEARARGYARLSLETGKAAAFDPAIRLYRQNGFAECAPFGDYVSDEFSLCMSREL